jgi:DNA-binding IclR family transcriptional regulator
MAGELRQRVIDVLGSEGPELPIAVLARRLDVPPTRLVPVLDELYEEGRVTTGRERATVALVPQPEGGGRFTRPASDREGRSTRAR